MSAHDDQQLLDNEDAAAMLRRILRLRDAKDREQEEVVRLTRELAAAKRRHKEAGWNLAAAEQSARQRIGRLDVVSGESLKPNGVVRKK